MEKRAYILYALLSVLLSILLGSCIEQPATEEPAKPPKEYTVQFVIDGSIVDLITVEESTLLVSTLQPEKSGYIFDGWYKESSFKTKWDFESDNVITNINLYGRWILDGVRFVNNSNDYFIWADEKTHLVEYSIGGIVTTTHWYLYYDTLTEKYILEYAGDIGGTYPIHSPWKSGQSPKSFSSYEELIAEDEVYFKTTYGLFTKVSP